MPYWKYRLLATRVICEKAYELKSKGSIGYETDDNKFIDTVFEWIKEYYKLTNGDLTDIETFGTNKLLEKYGVQ